MSGFNLLFILMFSVARLSAGRCWNGGTGMLTVLIIIFMSYGGLCEVGGATG